MRWTLPTPRNTRFLAGLVCLGLIGAARLAPGFPADPALEPSASARFEHATDRLLVRLSPSASRAARAELRASGARRVERARAGAALARLFADARIVRLEPEDLAPRPEAAGPLDDFWIACLAPGADADAVAGALARLPDVAHVERITLAPVMAVPNDSLFFKAWHLQQANDRDIDAPEAWDTTTGDSSAIIAILDTGVSLDHPDLVGRTPGAFGNFWVNRAESGGAPGVDDDSNGYVDDVRGWDFVDVGDTTLIAPGEDWLDEDADPNDYAVHGTAVAGVAAALTNNLIGVSGTAPGARLMALRVGYALRTAPTGVVDLSSAARAILYAVRNRAAVINCSFATNQQTDFVAAVDAAHAAGVIVVCSAGNNGISNWLPESRDVIAVGATDDLDMVTRFSNVGDYVDLCAPGQLLPSTTVTHAGSDSVSLRTPSYTAGASGTSFSSPMVAAAAALIQSRQRAQGLRPLSPPAMEMRLRETSDDITALNPGITGFGSGRLNLARALNDPPGSYTFACGSSTVGPVAVLAGPGATHRFAFVTADAQLLITRENGDTLVRVALPAVPLGGIASVSRGANGEAALFVALADRTIAGYDEQGIALSGWPAPATGVTGYTSVEPALGDIDGDGIADVVWGGNDGQVYAWRLCGGAMDGFPKFLVGPAENIRIAVAPMDREPGAEIIAAAPTGQVFVFNAAGAELPGWPVVVFSLPRTPLVIPNPNTADENMVVLSGQGTAIVDLQGRRITWSMASTVRAQADPSAADLDGDGRPEVVILCDPRADPFYYRGGIQIYNSFGVSLVGRDERLAAAGPAVLADGGLAWVGEIEGAQQLYARNTDGTPMANFVPKSGPSGALLTLANLDADPALEIVAGCRGSGAFFVYDGGAALGATALWPSSGGNESRTGTTLYVPPTTPYESLPPERVTDLRAAVQGTAAALLTWTAPADGGSQGAVCRYDLRYSETTLDSTTFDQATRLPEPATRAPGTVQTLTVPGLREDVTYQFAMRSRDAWGAVSPISNTTTLRIAAAPPAPVLDLRSSSVTDTTMNLLWTATGDDGRLGRPQNYVLRVSNQPLNEANFDVTGTSTLLSATVDAGGVERATVRGGDVGSPWYVAMRANDEIGLKSSISNVIELPLAGRSPAAVADLRVVSGEDHLILLRWTATGNDGTAGRPASYQVRAAHSPIVDEATFASAPVAVVVSNLILYSGSTETRSLALVPSDGWYVAIKAVDHLGQESPVSNCVAVPRTLADPAMVRDLEATMGSDSVATLRWTASGDDGLQGLPLHYWVRAAKVPFDDARFNDVPVRLEIDPTVTGGSREVLRISRLDPAHRWWFAIKAVDDAGNVSALSNVSSSTDLPINGVRPLTVAPVFQPSGAPVVLQWSNDAPYTPSFIRVYDISGRLQFEASILGASGLVEWDGTNRRGTEAPAGVYLAEIRHGLTTARSRVVLLR